MTKKTHKILLQCHSLVYFYMGLGAIYSKYPNEKLIIDVIVTSSDNLMYDLRKKIKLSKYINKTFVLSMQAFTKINKKIFSLEKTFFNELKYIFEYKKKILKILHENIVPQKYDDFVSLYQDYSPGEIGYKTGEKVDPSDMELYYSKEKIAQYGTLAIRVLVV